MDFITEFNKLAQDIYQTAKDKGWWDNERNDGEMIALMHSELSEALAALRHGNPPDDKVPVNVGEASGAYEVDAVMVDSLASI